MSADLVSEARLAKEAVERELVRIRQLRRDYDEGLAALDLAGAVDLLGVSRVAELLGCARPTIYSRLREPLPTEPDPALVEYVERI